MDEQPESIAPTAEVPLPNPPTSGNWTRRPDNSLVPADEATAQTAGLSWPGQE